MYLSIYKYNKPQYIVTFIISVYSILSIMYLGSYNLYVNLAICMMNDLFGLLGWILFIYYFIRIASPRIYIVRRSNKR